MIIDSNLMFSKAQDVSGAAQNSTNTIDIRKGGRDPGTGRTLYLVLVVTTALADANKPIKVALQGDPTSTIVPTKTRDLFTIPAQTAAGTAFISPLHPKGDPESQEFLSLGFSPTNGNLTVAGVSAFIVENPAAWAAYAKNYTID